MSMMYHMTAVENTMFNDGSQDQHQRQMMRKAVRCFFFQSLDKGLFKITVQLRHS
jgi:hypothetical protein